MLPLFVWIQRRNEIDNLFLFLKMLGGISGMGYSIMDGYMIEGGTANNKKVGGSFLFQKQIGG